MQWQWATQSHGPTEMKSYLVGVSKVTVGVILAGLITNVAPSIFPSSIINCDNLQQYVKQHATTVTLDGGTKCVVLTDGTSDNVIQMDCQLE